MKNEENVKRAKLEEFSTLRWLFIVVVALWALSCFALYLLFDKLENRGLIGDSFGVINSLFSGLAFAGIIFTIILQKRELSLQRQELAITRQELARTADAQEKSQLALREQVKSMTDTAKLNAINTVVSYYSQASMEPDGNWEWRVKAKQEAMKYVKQLEILISELNQQNK